MELVKWESTVLGLLFKYLYYTLRFVSLIKWRNNLLFVAKDLRKFTMYAIQIEMLNCCYLHFSN